MSMKVVPAGKYAHFTHCMKDGGFAEAFAMVDAWVKDNGIGVFGFGLQLFDSDWDLAKPESILHIFIPLH